MTTAIQTMTRTMDPVQFIADQQDTYTDHVKHFTGWIHAEGRDLDRESVIEYYQVLKASDLSAGTQRVKRQALKKRLRQLARAGGIGSDLSANMEQFLRDLDREGATKAPTIQQVPIERGKYMDSSEYERVLSACRGDRQAMIIRFLWTTGARVSEMIGIRRSDWQIEEERVLLRVTGKGSKERVLRIPRDLFDEIRDVFRGEEWLFETGNGRPYNRTYVSNQVARVTKRAIGRSLRAHSLRHSFATRTIRTTGKIEATSRYLGHSSPSITMQFYCHESLDDGELFGN